jgi:hypothetical protein
MAQTYSELADDDHNMLIQSQWPRQQSEFMDYLWHEADALEQVVAHHLSLRPHQKCSIAPYKEWLFGSFNVCIPVRVEENLRVVVRVPFPHRFVSQTSPHMASEKIRGEAATFAWLTSHCPNVPIPRFWGFGLSDGRAYTALAQTSWARRLYEWLRQRLRRGILNIDCWRPFVPSHCSVRLSTGYMIMDYVEPQQGSMLSTRGPALDPGHRRTLFRSLAKILVDLLQVPLPRIGSFTVLGDGEVTLSGRPLTSALALLEAQGIYSDILPGTTYSSANVYVDDLLHCHETRLRDQPNAVEGTLDAKGQMATVVVLKAVRSQFCDRKLRDGPFVLQFTDLHESNVFVDNHYNITSIVDLEWCCSLPIEMQQPQFWITGQEGNDFLRDPCPEKEATFLATYQEFLEVLTSEQIDRRPYSRLPFDARKIFETALEKRSHWYFAAVSHPRNAYNFLIDHIQPLFAPSHSEGEGAATFQDVFAPYYATNALEIAEKKVEAKERYDVALRALVENQTAGL